MEYQRRLSMQTSIDDPEWINWKFTCKSCGYRFKAITALEDYITCEHCTYCGSEDIEKEMDGGE